MGTDRLKIVRTELHMHSILSPCADRESTPLAMIRACVEKGLGMAALTDHNSGENAGAFVQLAQEAGIVPIVGMEMETWEGVHLLCLFPHLKNLYDWQKTVYENLQGRYDTALMELQEKVACDGERVLKMVDRPLGLSSNIRLESAVTSVQSLGGLAIPAHIDRSYNGLLAQMGTFPQGIPFDALEVTRHCSVPALIEACPQIKSFTLLRGGDAHRPCDILGSNGLYLKEASFEELMKALHGVEGRRVTMD